MFMDPRRLVPRAWAEFVQMGQNSRSFGPCFDRDPCPGRTGGAPELQQKPRTALPIDDVVLRRLAGRWPRIRLKDSARWLGTYTAERLIDWRRSSPMIQRIFRAARATDAPLRHRSGRVDGLLLLRAPNLAYVTGLFCGNEPPDGVCLPGGTGMAILDCFPGWSARNAEGQA